MLLSFSPIEFNNRVAFSFCSGRSEPGRHAFFKPVAQVSRILVQDIVTVAEVGIRREIAVETTQRAIPRSPRNH